MADLHEKCERDIRLEAQRQSAARKLREKQLLMPRQSEAWSNASFDIQPKEDIRAALSNPSDSEAELASGTKREWPIEDYSRDKVTMSILPAYHRYDTAPWPNHIKHRTQYLPFTVRKQKKDERRWMQVGRASLADPETASSALQMNSSQRWKPSKGMMDWEWSWEVRAPELALEYFESDFEKMNESIPAERKEVAIEDIMKPARTARRRKNQNGKVAVEPAGSRDDWSVVSDASEDWEEVMSVIAALEASEQCQAGSSSYHESEWEIYEE